MRCGDCGSWFDLAARNVRAARKRGEDPRCGPCRGIRIPPVRVTEARRRYWLDRFSLDALRELAAGIWPSAV